MCAAERRTHSLHDPAFLARLFAPFERHESVLLAVSGGPDSTALMLLAHRWRSARPVGPRLFAATVDHGLRPAGREEARAAGAVAAMLGIDHVTLDWTGAKPATGLQESAREARYALLGARARAIGATAIATAHTRDDQAETVLFRLMRGSGLAGLAGMAAERDLAGIALLRPLLDVPKAALVALCEDEGVPFAEDPSNRDPRFTRARLRVLMPSLAAEGLDAERLATLARRAARAEMALEGQTDAALARLVPDVSPLRFDAAAFAALPEEIGVRLLGRMIARAGDEGPIELGKLETLAETVRDAAISGREMARTLAGALVRVRGGVVSIGPAPARRVRNSSR